MKKLLLVFTLFVSLCTPFYVYSTAATESSYTTLRSVDLGTFNEYRYRITEQFFLLRDGWEIDGELKKKTLEEIGLLADRGYKYLPDNLENKNLLKKLLTALQRGVKYPTNDSNYTEVIQAISDYLDNADIDFLKGGIEVNPKIGNAPLNATLRADITDPTGAVIPSHNYTWWFDVGGERVVIGRGISLNYTFREEGNYSVFLDVVSNHRNELGNIDVLPFRSRADIIVEEKIASLIVKVNGQQVTDNGVLKFTPNEAGYGLLFDATSSTPTGGARFTSTEWDFGNGITRRYNGGPRVERVKYAREGDYIAFLRLKTNEGKTIEVGFDISVHDPVATIHSVTDQGFIGDTFTFSAQTGGDADRLSYAWEIIDIDNDEVIHRKNDKLFTYVFTDKGRFNTRLRITEPSGETDIDTRIVYINSKPPVADFSSTVPLPNKPNRVLLDASRSFDPDFSDDGKLSYTWYIDGERVNLEDANTSGSVGYYVFDSIGNHDVTLEVRDPDGIPAIKKGKVRINSILSVEMFAFPRVIQRESFIRFVAESPQAEIYEWDFGDGTKEGGSTDSINHTYKESGSFDVKLTVIDADNKRNTFIKTVYVGESDSPVAVLNVNSDSNELIKYDAGACSGQGAFLASRVSGLRFDALESINVDGSTSGLEYSWKIGNSKFATSTSINHKFDEIGCFPVKLTVKSKKSGRTSTRQVMIDISNQLPIVSTLDVQIENEEADPLIVNVSALGAKDPDGVIQSYLWYYYTDTDSTPQDFRSSVKPNTTFVLPKITGQYFFVVIMKDNNEARVNSEEATGSKFFTTITGDNINTPLIDLKVNDTSLSIGDEIVFSTEVKDILGQDLSKKSKYSWDFDGDGFYDIETSEQSVSYKYKKSGEFHAKVKVKHKGISSTKTVTINVSNKILPDFDYISIGNTFVFFDTSNGELDTRDWDLGDGTKKSGSTFVHEYTDKASSHEVILKVSEGTNVKQVKKKVVKNVKNVLLARSDGLNIFSAPTLNAEGNIILEQETQKLYLYLGASKGDIEGYAIDYNIEVDSDLSGASDDDRDNQGTSSFTSGDVIEVPLDSLRTQSIRVFLLGANDAVIESQDIVITKSYIEEQDIDLDSIEFLNVTQSEKQKIAELKELLSELPQIQRLEAMNFIKRMQEGWSDDTEKTRVIIEFETYLFDQDIENTDEIITVLESLLVEGQEDSSAKNVAYNALRNLIPETIDCPVEGEFASCQEMLISRLDSIRDSNDIEANKILGSSILSSIADTDTMTNAQKLDFKEILSSLVYGDVANIPEEERNEVIATAPEPSSGGGIIDILIKVLYYLGLFFLLCIGIIALYFLYYKLTNKDETQGFQDFIINKTALKKESKTPKTSGVALSDNALDILEETPAADPLSDTPTPKASTQTDPLENPKQELDPIPDPLSETTENTIEVPTEEDTSVPDWLSGNIEPTDTPESSQDIPEPIEETPAIPVQEKVDDQVDPAPTPDLENTKTPDIEEETEIADDQVPDWLKQDLSAGTDTKQSSDTPEVVDSEVKTNTDESIPDWLAGSFDEDTSEVVEDSPESSDTVEEKQPEQEAEKKSPVKTKAQEDMSESVTETPKSPKPKRVQKKKAPVSKDKKATEKKTTKPKKPVPTKTKQTPDTKDEAATNKKSNNELWDDGMKVPDWLKTGD